MFLPIGQTLVFARHTLQFVSCAGRGRKARLLPAQRFERAVEVGTLFFHRPTLNQRGEGRIYLG